MSKFTESGINPNDQLFESTEADHENRKKFVDELFKPYEQEQEVIESKVKGLVGKMHNRALLAEQAAVDAMSLAETSQVDVLTSLPGRKKFLDEVNGYLAGNAPSKAAVVFLDLDFFKQRNDGFGHDVGDETLKELAKYLKKAFGEKAFYGRWGGEEFVVVIPNMAAEDIQARFPEFSFAFVSTIKKGEEFKTTASVGVAEWHYKDTLDVVINHADHAMYVKKNNGKNGVEVYTEKVEEAFQKLMAEKQNKKGY